MLINFLLVYTVKVTLPGRKSLVHQRLLHLTAPVKSVFEMTIPKTFFFSQALLGWFYKCTSVNISVKYTAFHCDPVCVTFPGFGAVLQTVSGS